MKISAYRSKENPRHIGGREACRLKYRRLCVDSKIIGHFNTRR